MEAIAHRAGPEAARGAKLRNLNEKFVVRVEKERKLRREIVDREAGINRGLDVRNSVRQRKCNFLNVRRTGFTNVVAGD